MASNNYVLIALLAAVIVASGCVGQSQDNSFSGEISDTQGEVEQSPDEENNAQQEYDADTTSQEEQTQTYTLNVDVEGEGTVSPEEGSHTYDEGETVRFNPDPSDGWVLDSFRGDCSGDSCEVTMNQDRTADVEFVREPISYSDVEDSVSVVDFNYGGNFESAITPSSSEGTYFKQFSFKVDYTPQGDREMYFQAYTEGEDYTTSDHFQLQPGENEVELNEDADEAESSTEVSLCYSYTGFYITTSGEVFNEETNEEMDEDRYVCRSEIFDAPQFEVDAPQSVEFNGEETSGGSTYWDNKEVTITNEGDFTQTYYIFVPNRNDGTDDADRRRSEIPDYREVNPEYDANLEPGESHTFEFQMQVEKSQDMPYSFEDTAYVYTAPSCNALYKAECHQDAGWKESITLETTVSN
jgi:hypothetical protein